MERSLQQVCFKHRHANIAAAGNDVGWSCYSIYLPERSFVVVILLRLPGSATEIPGIIEGQIVITPHRGMFNGAGSRHCGFEAAGLSDQPVRQITAITVSADGEPVGVGDPIAHESIDSFHDVLAGPGKKLGRNVSLKFISVTAGAAIVGPKNQPSLGGGEDAPVVVIGTELVAVGAGGSSVNQRQHAQVLGTELTRRIDQHPFDFSSIIR